MTDAGSEGEPLKSIVFAGHQRTVFVVEPPSSGPREDAYRVVKQGLGPWAFRDAFEAMRPDIKEPKVAGDPDDSPPGPSSSRDAREQQEAGTRDDSLQEQKLAWMLQRFSPVSRNGTGALRIEKVQRFYSEDLGVTSSILVAPGYVDLPSSLVFLSLDLSLDVPKAERDGCSSISAPRPLSRTGGRNGSKTS